MYPQRDDETGAIEIPAIDITAEFTYEMVLIAQGLAKTWPNLPSNLPSNLPAQGLTQTWPAPPADERAGGGAIDTARRPALTHAFASLQTSDAESSWGRKRLRTDSSKNEEAG